MGIDLHLALKLLHISSGGPHYETHTHTKPRHLTIRHVHIQSRGFSLYDSHTNKAEGSHYKTHTHAKPRRAVLQVEQPLCQGCCQGVEADIRSEMEKLQQEADAYEAAMERLQAESASEPPPQAAAALKEQQQAERRER